MSTSLKLLEIFNERGDRYVSGQELAGLLGLSRNSVWKAVTALRREGYRGGGWILLDFGCVIVHIFQKEMREFYNLEHLWNDAEEVPLSSL